MGLLRDSTVLACCMIQYLFLVHVSDMYSAVSGSHILFTHFEDPDKLKRLLLGVAVMSLCSRACAPGGTR